MGVRAPWPTGDIRLDEPINIQYGTRGTRAVVQPPKQTTAATFSRACPPARACPPVRAYSPTCSPARTCPQCAKTISIEAFDSQPLSSAIWVQFAMQKLFKM